MGGSRNGCVGRLSGKGTGDGTRTGLGFKGFAGVVGLVGIGIVGDNGSFVGVCVLMDFKPPSLSLFEGRNEDRELLLERLEFAELFR